MKVHKTIFILLFLYSLKSFSQYNINTNNSEDIRVSDNINIFNTDSDILIAGDKFSEGNSVSIVPNNNYVIKIVIKIEKEGEKPETTRIRVEDEDEKHQAGRQVNPNTSNTTIYPNPTTNAITITSDKTISSIDVFDNYGVKQQIGITNNILDLKNLKKGLYLVKIHLKNGKTIKKTIVKQ